MSFEVLSMCRGDGVASILIQGKERTGDSLDYRVISDKGIDLPSEVYTSHDIDGIPAGSIVLTTPLLDVKFFEIAAYEKGAASVSGESGDVGVKPVKKVSISQGSLKWQSRWNYRVHRNLAYAIRNLNKEVLVNQVNSDTTVFLRNLGNTQFIVKALAFSPDTEDDLEVVLINGQGQRVDKPNIYLPPKEIAYSESIPCTKQQFTMRIPNDGTTYCILVKSKKGLRQSFICFDKASIAATEEWYISHPYRYFLPDVEKCVYPSFRREQKFELDLLASQIDKDKNGAAQSNSICFSIVVPLYKTPEILLREMIDSVIAQTYSNWELVLVNASPEDAEIKKTLSSYNDERIKVVEISENKGIAENTNVGVKVARGDFIGLLDHDDTLDEHALSEYYRVLCEHPETDALYCDEDNITPEGDYISPHFKSDLNIDLLRCHNYITHFLVARASLMKELLFIGEYDGAQDYDFLLRLYEKTQNIFHVRSVLYHWRMSETSSLTSADNKKYAEEAGKRALEAHIERMNLDADVQYTDVPFIYNVEYHVIGSPLASIIIPSKDNAEVLGNCISSLYEKTTYRNFEVIIVENNSTEDSTFEMYEKLKAKYGVQVVTWDKPFNYSAVNNFGFNSAKGEFIVLLNNDTEIQNPKWLDRMIADCQRENVGIVGAKLFFPDNTIQHAGVSIRGDLFATEIGGPYHVFCNFDGDDPCYMWRANLKQTLLGVTAACIVVRRNVYEELNGLNEEYVVAYNDIDFCLRAREAGYRIVYEPNATLIHFESLSRGADEKNSKSKARFYSEQGLLRNQWSKYYVDGDPYYETRNSETEDSD